MIDCALVLGSSAGTLDTDRLDVREVVATGIVREEMAGRTRAAPEINQLAVTIQTGRAQDRRCRNNIPMALFANLKAIVMERSVYSE